MAIEIIKVPDIGGAEDVDVIEISVSPGDTVAAEDSLVVLESDKASMDIPSPQDGKIVKILIKEGDKVSEGTPIAEIEAEGVEGSSGDELSQNTQVPVANSAVVSEASEHVVQVPDIGGAEEVDVIELSVQVGDEVGEGDSLIVLESDKASMDIPSPVSGRVLRFIVKEGDKVAQGSDIVVLSVAGGSSESKATAPETSPQVQASDAQTSELIDIQIPDIGDAQEVDVIEVCVGIGDIVAEGDSLIVLETDKASMEIPSPASGTIKSLAIKEGDKVSMGMPIGKLETSQASVGAPSSNTSDSAKPASATPAPAVQQAQTSNAVDLAVTKSASGDFYAGPAVRKLARELGCDLSEVRATGPRGRITNDDVKNHVKTVMQSKPKGVQSFTGGSIPPIPEVDFAKFGDIELLKMSKIKKVTAANMTRNWLNVPHVTQFDDVDITELEAFRKALKPEAEKAGAKLTPLPFLLKACAAALKAEPSFNVSLHADGEHIVQKNYVHIGIAVDTPNGLVVPVIRDVDQKGLYQLAKEVIEMAGKARDGKLMPSDMQGGCFTISSLGAIGGTGFTPMINAPEVSILGVSKSQMKPVWNGKEFEPRLMLPLSLSYDHRAVNGADAGRFFVYLNAVIADIRRVLL